MKRTENRWMFILLLFVFFSAKAQQEAEIWTLEKCIEHALENNLDVRRNGLNVENAGADYLGSRFSRLPDLNANSSYRSSWGRSIDPTTNDFINTQSGFVNVGATSNVLLFNGFRVNNTIKQNEKTFEAAREDQEQTEANISLNVAGTYLNVIFNKELLETARLQLNSTRSQLERTRKQVDAGSVPRSNLLELQAQEATNELNVINQENALNLSLLQLKQLLQLPASRNIDVEVPKIEVQTKELVIEDLESIYEEGLTTQHSIKGAELRLSSSEYAILAAKGSLYPRLSFTAGINSNYSSWADRQRFVADGNDPVIVPQAIGYVQGTGTTVLRDIEVPSGQIVDGYGLGDQINDNLSKFIGFTLSVPVFNAYSARLNVRRAELGRESNSIQLEQAKNTLRQDIESAYYDVVAASKSYSASQKQVDALRESYRMVSQRYEIGAMDFTQFQVSQNELFRAESDLLRSKYDLIFKQRILDFYRGQKLELR